MTEQEHQSDNVGNPGALQQQWQTQVGADVAKNYEEDPRCRVCILSRSSTKVVVLESVLRSISHLSTKRFIGADSGEAKRQALEDINETLEDVNVFFYSPAIESGVATTVKVKKV